MALNVTLCGLLFCWIALFYPLAAVAALAVNYFFVKQDFGKEDVNPHDLHLEVLWDDENWPEIFFWAKVGVLIFYILCFCGIVCFSCRRRNKTVFLVNQTVNDKT